MQKLSKQILLAGLSLLFSLQSYAEEQELEQSLLFFPILHAEIRPDVTDEHGLDSSEVHFGSDVLYSLRYKKYRVLTEFYASMEEVELERLQFAVEANSSNIVWLGRFHAPLGYWNSQYHHGVHLQTSVHRPAIVEYEDQGGVIGNHMTGIMFEGNKLISESLIHYSIALGTAPILKDQALQPWATSDSGSKHGLQAAVRLSYQPDEISPTQYGVFGSFANINAEDEPLNNVIQFTGGVFVHQDWSQLKLTTAGFYVDNRLEEKTKTHSSGFLSTYAHVEYELARKWLAYGRVERAFGEREDEYLEYLDDPNLNRNLGGLRFDFTRRQAISTELSKRVNDHNSHTHISIQWSAVFP